MTLVTHGMDVAAGLAAADTMTDGATAVRDLAARLDAALEGFTWTGPDAERVRGEWSFTRRPQLVLVAEHLFELAVRLRAEADAQEVASGGEGATGAAGGSAGPQGPPPEPQGLLGRVGDWIGDRLVAGGQALGRFLGAQLDLQGKVLDVLLGRGDHSVASIAASAITGLGALAGVGVNLWTGEDRRWFTEGGGRAGDPVAVPAHDGGPSSRPALEPPRSLDAIMQSVTDAYTNGTTPGSDGEVRIVRVDNGGTPAYVVAVPGTETWSPSGGTMPRDLTANVQLMAGNPTAAAESVRAAMERAGIPAGAPVLMVGHSQGGMITGHLAADPGFRERFNVTNMVTYGSPVDHLRIEGVQVLQMGHSLDPVPRADLGGWQPGGLPSVGQQVELPSPAAWNDVLGNHSHEAYIRTVHDALASDSALGDQLRAYQSDPSMAPFLVGPDGSASAVDVPIGRDVPRREGT
ncbi:hypothetical protein INN71_10865 [Nocardioides sp. ChNu-153]|uniref:hypothetical protein n=1 Tax=unclassified Nocardioides TaxID=2615069 RepID=UPI002404F38B|nr:MULTISPECIES: hypothetical protein [unclassified Nocardioides]MDF9715786.1 alpha/beta hydrolase [Nocardioides sp. ChNu-99]MDN7121891.1 hypothetical protein [Nocardioides sp. ChNu-153]